MYSSSLKKRYVSKGHTCIVSCKNLYSSIWNKWLLQLQSELPKPIIGLLFLQMVLAVLHSSILFALFTKTLMIFAASLSSK